MLFYDLQFDLDPEEEKAFALFMKGADDTQKSSKVSLGDLIEKKLEDNGRVLVRYSGTENLLRVMLEGQDKKEIKKFAQDIINVAKKEIEKTVKGK